jgi:4-amino-4-deoxy-L-arabinose transferase-like glycosyltransferase/lipid-A-disaccharide synthase-like uncharacterized protein
MDWAKTLRVDDEKSGVGGVSPPYAGEAVPIVLLWVMLAVAIMVPLVSLGRPELGSPHEARVVVTGHNMAELGDWVVPRFNGSPRLQKPPLPYWTIAAMVELFGPLDERLFRLPSALMGICGVLVTLAVGRLVFDLPTGLVAALIQLFTVKYIIESRLARVDIYLTFWVSVCLLILSILFFAKKRRDWLWVLLGAAIAMGFLAKWVAVFVFVLPVMLYGLLVFPKRRPRWRWGLVGVCACAVLGLSWIAILAQRLGWEAVWAGWTREVQDNITSPIHRANHGILYYIPQIFTVSFPWSVVIPVGLTLPLWRRLKADRSRLVWFSLWVLVPLVVLSLVSKKKADYLLPALPAMAILGARAWRVVVDEISCESGTKTKSPNRSLGVAQAVVFVVTGILTLLYCFMDTELHRFAAIIICGVGLMGGGVAAYLFLIKGKGWLAMAALAMGSTVFGYVLFGVFLPLEARTSSAGFARAIVDAVGDSPLVYFQGSDDTLVYHLHRNIPSISKVEQLRGLMAERPETFILAEGRSLDAAREVAGHVVLHHPKLRDASLPLPGKEQDAFNVYLLSNSSSSGSVKEFASISPTVPEWVNGTNLWIAFGFLAQAMFFGRFLLQWIESERRQECVVPVGFWWLSVVGGVMLFVYAVHRRDPVFIAGQGCGMLIYLRNLYFIYAKRFRGKPGSGEGSTPIQ